MVADRAASFKQGLTEEEEERKQKKQKKNGLPARASPFFILFRLEGDKKHGTQGDFYSSTHLLKLRTAQKLQFT